MTTQHDLVVRTKHQIVPLPGISLAELCRLCECQLAVMRRLVDMGVLEPVAKGPEPLYAGTSVLRARKALRLRHDLNLNFDAVALVMELLDRIDELERRLAP